MRNTKGITKEDFEKFVTKEKKVLFRVACSILQNTHDAEDAVSDALLFAWEKRGSVKRREKFNTWVMRILINTAKTFLRQRNRVVVTNNVEIEDIEMPVDISEDMQLVINSLKEEYRIIIILYFINQYSQKEIAQILNTSTSAVKSSIYRAKEELKKRWLGKEDSDDRR